MADEPQPSQALRNAQEELRRLQQCLHQINEEVWKLDDRTGAEARALEDKRNEAADDLCEVYKTAVRTIKDAAERFLFARSVMQSADEADAVWLACGLEGYWWGGTDAEARGRILEMLERRYTRIDAGQLGQWMIVAELCGGKKACRDRVEAFYRKEFVSAGVPDAWLGLETDFMSPQRAAAVIELEAAAYRLEGEERRRAWAEALRQ